MRRIGDKKALSFLVFSLAAALNMFSASVLAVAVLAYWTLVRVLENAKEFTEADFPGDDSALEFEGMDEEHRQFLLEQSLSQRFSSRLSDDNNMNASSDYWKKRTLLKAASIWKHPMKKPDLHKSLHLASTAAPANVVFNWMNS